MIPPDDSSVSADRKLGRYYTPADVADVLVEWALDGATGPLLDPSFGGCSILEAGLRRLSERVNGEAPKLIHGVDVDPDATIHGQTLVTAGVPASNLRHADFLHLTPDDFDITFHCAVGNPPFVRHHWLDGEAARKAQEAVRSLGCYLPRTANSWAYFIAMSAQFLAPHGRIAFLVPTTGLQADYASSLLQFLEESFHEIRLLPLKEALFHGTRERVTVLLAAGWQGGPGRIDIAETVARSDLRDAVSGTAERARKPDVEDAWELYERVMGITGWTVLGEIARVDIGIVTGANRFFIRRPTEVEVNRLSSDPIITTSRRLTGLRWLPEDVEAMEAANATCRLLRLPKGASVKRGHLGHVIAEGEQAGIHHRYHCRKRSPWWSITDRVLPDAFLHYMAGRAPRVVLNEAGSLCTNAIHRITWTDREVDASAVAASTCSTLFQLACELHSRTYSGGALKLEPTAAKRLPVSPSGRSQFNRLDQALRVGNPDKARDIVDASMLTGAGVLERDIIRMRACISRLREHRGVV